TGVTPRYVDILGRSIIAGRMFTEDEVSGGARVAVIGSRVVENLFRDTNPLGQNLRIEGVPVQIVGVLNVVGSASFGPGTDQDNVVLIPITTAQQRFTSNRTTSGERSVTAIIVEARDQSTVRPVVEQIRQTLRELHDISFRDEDDFIVATQEDLLTSVGNFTALLTIFLAVIAGISLLV